MRTYCYPRCIDTSPGNSIRLGPIDTEASEKLIEQAAPSAGESTSLATELDGLPLAIVHAARYIAGAGVSADAYLQRLRTNEAEALRSAGLRKRSESRLCVIVQDAFHAALSESMIAGVILQLVAHGDYADFPVSELAPVFEASTGVSPDWLTQSDVDQAIAVLTEMSLARVDRFGSERVVRVHPMIRAALRTTSRDVDRDWTNEALVNRATFRMSGLIEAMDVVLSVPRGEKSSRSAKGNHSHVTCRSRK